MVATCALISSKGRAAARLLDDGAEQVGVQTIGELSSLGNPGRGRPGQRCVGEAMGSVVRCWTVGSKSTGLV